MLTNVDDMGCVRLDGGNGLLGSWKKVLLLGFVFWTGFAPVAEAIPREGELEWGFYQMLTRRESWGERIDAERNAVGGDPSLVLFFRDMSPRRGFPDTAVSLAAERGLTPIVSLEPQEWGQRGEGGFLQAIVRGEYDNYFRQWASGAKESGTKLFLRFGFEMNGDWFSWGAQPEAFRAAWLRAHRIFKEVGADNVHWMFSPNILWAERSVERDLAPYWPGDEVVDVIGLDGYNFGDHHDEWHKWQSFDEVFSRTIDAVEHWGKPIYISEIGCADDPRKATWISNFLEKVSSDPRIHGFVYFNHYNPRKAEPNWRWDSDVETLAAFRSWAQAHGSLAMDLSRDIFRKNEDLKDRKPSP